MPVDRPLWHPYWDVEVTKAYPCPRCQKGHVRRGDNKLNQVEPHHSEREHKREEWDPDWTVYSFTMMLTCDNKACGEVVSVSGRGGVEPAAYDEEDGRPQYDWEAWLRPMSMYPAPLLFPIPKSIPKTVQDELRLAFQLYWADLSASTSRLRTSLERVLDDRGVPTMQMDKNNNPKRMNLFDRIDFFDKANEDPDIAEAMTALRIVGNLGTHGDEVKDGDYFSLLDVYEEALLAIYEQKKDKMKAMRQQLIALKDS